jgi:hypothetical protein
MKVSLSAHIYLTLCDVFAARNSSTQQRCASNLVCAHCGESGHGDEPYPYLPHCVICLGAHTSSDRTCPIYLDEKAIQELWAKEGLSCLDAQKKYKESNPKTGSYSYSTVLHHAQGIDAATQTTSAPNKGTSPIPSNRSVSTQSEVSTETGELSSSALCSTNLDVGQPPVHDVAQTDTVCQKSPQKKLGRSWSHSGACKIQREQFTVTGRSASVSDSSDSQMDHICTPKGKHRWRRKRSPLKAP